MSGVSYYIMQLKVLDPIKHIRKAKHLYLENTDVSEKELVENLIRDAKHFGITAKVKECSGFHFVYSDTDWFDTIDISTYELFSRVHGLEGAGMNSHRSEVLLNAFAEDVIVYRKKEYIPIKISDRSYTDIAVEVISSNFSEQKLVVAFRVR